MALAIRGCRELTGGPSVGARPSVDGLDPPLAPNSPASTSNSAEESASEEMEEYEAKWAKQNVPFPLFFSFVPFVSGRVGGKEIRVPYYDSRILRLYGWMLGGDGNGNGKKSVKAGRCHIPSGCM